VNVDTLVSAMPGLDRARATTYLPLMEQAMREYQITSRERSAMFLAQCGHESVSLRYLEEIADGSQYENRCSDLGNCYPGDGRKFKGRGPIQITGRFNYTAAGKALSLPLTDQPHVAAQPQHAFRISAWWWGTHGVNAAADARDVIRATRIINGGTNGLADRQNRYTRCWNLGAAVVPGPGGVTTGGDEMTPAVAWWGNNYYYAVRGSDARIYYRGPDTKGQWAMVDRNSHAISGVSMNITADGNTVIAYVNNAGHICTYWRGAGKQNWTWADQGGKVT
jgi:predicted chitinase